MRRTRTATLGTLAGVAVLAACAGAPAMPTPDSSSTPSPTASYTSGPVRAPGPAPGPTPAPDEGAGGGSGHPWHTGIVATTFWVGEIFDPDAPDGSQELSTYDSDWLGSYGGCDGIAGQGECRTEPRTAANDYFPTSMTPLENPFYLDLPYDDINDPIGFAERDAVIPWAGEEPYRSHRGDQNFSYLKNRWVQLVLGDRSCYGQIEDAGPGEYHDAAYVFGADDARPANTRYGGAGMDVSPALTGCLGFTDLDGITPGISWRFVESWEVPPGPWTRLVTTSGVR
ncbi:MAG TPA: hypothetical protein VKY66_04685 [Protaetiibacter sp.]|nr:hypothetical protein [Protaetiibacter sp.]